MLNSINTKKEEKKNIHTYIYFEKNQNIKNLKSTLHVINQIFLAYRYFRFITFLLGLP